MRNGIYFLIPLILLTLSLRSFSQETTAEIQGKVSDDKNGPMAGATVVAVHSPSGTKYATTTRKDGRYNLPNLRIGGPYVVTVSFMGFKDEHQDNINLLLGQEFKVDFTLSEQARQLTEVTVTAARQGRV